MHTMKKFIRYYAPYKAVFFLDLICAAVISLVDLAFPQILRTLTKTLFAEPADRILQALLPIGAGLLVIYILQALADQFGVDKEKITADSISGAVSQEMKRDAIVAVTIATICMLIYIWFRFSNITFAAGAVLALMHDVLVVLTCYAMLRWSVGSTFIACMLTIVGYSINATIVIFDRIRENMKLLGNKESAETIVNTSISQTLTRSINTTLTTFVMVLILYILGVSSIREFALPLMVGLICGTYSSVCLSGSVWYVLNKKRMEKNAKPAGKKAKAEK